MNQKKRKLNKELQDEFKKIEEEFAKNNNYSQNEMNKIFNEAGISKDE